MERLSFLKNPFWSLKVFTMEFLLSYELLPLSEVPTDVCMCVHVCAHIFQSLCRWISLEWTLGPATWARQEGSPEPTELGKSCPGSPSHCWGTICAAPARQPPPDHNSCNAAAYAEIYTLSSETRVNANLVGSRSLASFYLDLRSLLFSALTSSYSDPWYGPD